MTTPFRLLADGDFEPVTLSRLQAMIGVWAESKGWVCKPEDTVEKLCLMHSEISEALEEWRKEKSPTDIYFVDGKPEGIPIELADLVIRVMQYCDSVGIDLERSIIEKMIYNETRPFRHGKKI